MNYRLRIQKFTCNKLLADEGYYSDSIDELEDIAYMKLKRVFIVYEESINDWKPFIAYHHDGLMDYKIELSRYRL